MGEMLVKEYKLNKLWRCNVQHGDDCQQYSIAYLKYAKRANLKCSHHTQ